MAKTNIYCSLSSKSLNKAIKAVRAYREKIENKNELFIKRLAEVGIDTIRDVMQYIPGEEAGRYDVEKIINKSNNMVGATIRLSGEKVLFIEFSAGVTYGTQHYPLPSGNQYGAGTYPSDKNNWSNPHGWWYKDEAGEVHHTYGNRAYMPMYHAEEAIIMVIREVAREVFGG